VVAEEAAVALAAAAAAARALHTGLCCFQLCIWQALLQYRAVRHPAQVGELPFTRASSDGGAMLLHTALLQALLIARLVRASPMDCRCCTKLRAASVLNFNKAGELVRTDRCCHQYHSRTFQQLAC